ncbi:MAG: transposase, partial [Ectothiorhodospiraceae bacterium AqS1]|nr:transposase [Ectothiorhodospiraceae bacterium AqS1]
GTGEVRAILVDLREPADGARRLSAMVEPGSVVFTDNHFAYRYIERLPYFHESVNHSENVFVRKGVHTNGIESVWAALERSFKGIDHHRSVKNCRRYIDELTFRLNEGS